MTSIKQALVLAAGFGTRLTHWTDQHPKALAPVGGRPNLRNVLDALSLANIEHVVVNVHHRAQMIEDYLTKVSDEFSFQLAISHEDEILGTGGGIAHAKPLLRQESFFVMNSDVVTNVDLVMLAKQHQASKALATMVLRKDADAERFGSFCAQNGQVVKFLDMGDLKRTGDLMFTGIHCMRYDVFEDLHRDEFSSVINELYRPAFSRGDMIGAYIHNGYWADIGTPERLTQANKDLICGHWSLPASVA